MTEAFPTEEAVMQIIKGLGIAVACLAATATAGLNLTSVQATPAPGAATGIAQEKMPAGVQSRKLDNGTMVLADAKGMTLYTFEKDAAGKSACSGNCAKNWPPLAAAADAKPMGDWTIITRDDGSRQWAYKGKPLYGWFKDTKPGETTGDGVGNGAWKTAVP
jgi:predicted lipoprotein with Yx(FWY)xxD motif